MQDSNKDINDIFDDILLSEEKLIQTGYQEGFQLGESQGSPEGFHLGYHRGAEIGAELGYYKSFLQELKSHEKITKICNDLITTIDNFPKANVDSIDIIQTLDDIRAKFKKITALSKIHGSVSETDKLSF